jgi:hypothetical protein
MAIDIGGSGFMGLGFEATVGVYIPPTKFFPILGETMQFQPNNTFRRPIRQTVDQLGMVPGNISTGGTITMEALDDVIVYWLYAMRMGIVKTGATAPYTYTCTPTQGLVPNRTLSLTIVRAGTAFGFTGCVVSKMTLSVQNGLLQADMDIVGTNENSVALPTSTYLNSAPFGPGQWNIQIPTPTQIFDMDTFSFSIDEKAAAQYRLKNTGANQGRGAQFVAYAERTIQMTASRDFVDRTDYQAFQNNIPQSISIQAVASANSSITFTIPVAYKSTYDVPLGQQGNLIRGNLTYDTVIDGTGKACQLVVVTNESIT